jgi:hypothetical protein
MPAANYSQNQAIEKRKYSEVFENNTVLFGNDDAAIIFLKLQTGA